MMNTWTVTLDAVGASGSYFLPAGVSATYTATEGETFAGRIFLERAMGDGAWETIASDLDVGFTGTLKNETGRPQRYRFRLEAEDDETPVADDILCQIIDTVAVLHELREPRGQFVASLSADGKVILADTAAICLGDPTVLGGWQFVRSGDDLLVQRLEGEPLAWVTKSTIAAAP